MGMGEFHRYVTVLISDTYLIDAIISSFVLIMSAWLLAYERCEAEGSLETSLNHMIYLGLVAIAKAPDLFVQRMIS